ncbi:hypothetical protein LMG6001_04885 [Achromobacter insolitus]|uniref:hypothetical protein n=1 Tax=Achromobacter insolitus TaxID=217204 RepID=UPI001465F47C|nr:hypothetical protein [Achromobacter insolitus]CAB3957854.1 hypothetical protein LMG6001_04885 [Achromobacter insolitus]
MSTQDRELARRHYYSVRSGKRAPSEGFGLADFKKFFRAVFDNLWEEGFFQEWFGYSCIDAGDVNGKAGGDIDLFVFRKLRTMGLWPIWNKLDEYSEEDLFDVIEFLYDHVSKGVDGTYHNYNQCGWHYNKFDQKAGRDIFRKEMNDILADYKNGFELSAQGEILTIPEDEFAPMLSAVIPHTDNANVRDRVESAKLKYRRRSIEDRKDAIRDLAGVLEFLREEVRPILNSKDEADLFQLANNFGIRHHRKDQKTNYDASIWLSWMFYYYLATIHACLRLIEKGKASAHVSKSR